MTKALLTDRLWVPEDEVSPDAIEAYSYTFEEEEQVRDDDGSTRMIMVQRDVTTFKKKLDQSGRPFYGFARGHFGKLKKYFGHLEWVDQRSTPKMVSGLEYNDEMFPLCTWEEHHRGQVEAIDEWMKYKNGILQAPPRFGKTVSAVNIACRLGYKTLIVTHQRDLLEQFYEEIENCTNFKDIHTPRKPRSRDAKGVVVGFFEQFKNPEELDICLLCYQTFTSKYGPERLKKFKNTWGLVIVDECHASGAYRYAGMVNSLNPKHRLGLSGTPDRTDRKEELVEDIIGPVVAVGKVKEVPCKVLVVKTNIRVPYREGKERSLFLMKRLYKNEDRLGDVLKYLEYDVKLGRAICIGFHSGSVEQLEHFTEMLQIDYGYSAECFHGATPDRKAVLKRFKTGETQIAVCNRKMLTGINVPRWEVYYSMFPDPSVRVKKYRKNGEDKFRIGGNYPQRCKRACSFFKYEDGRQKQFAVVRDFVDKGNYSERAFKARLRMYQLEGFEVVVKEIPRKEVMFDAE